ncbi:MAG: hypothetical protein RIR97_232 [Pseudomonadota bacterium]|jgi:uncharacterized membrane protein
MKLALVAYAGTFSALLIADAIWLGIVAKTFYRNQLGDMMLPSPNLTLAAVFYIFFAAALVLLVVVPGVKQGTLLTTALYGAAFGLAAYGTYDITNLATLKNWPVTVTVVDMIWGTTVTAFSASIGYSVAKYFV